MNDLEVLSVSLRSLFTGKEGLGVIEAAVDEIRIISGLGPSKGFLVELKVI